MIVAERKPLEDILKYVSGRKKVLVLGCGGCVSVCLTGGEKEAEILASELRIALGKAGHKPDISVRTVTRQCDREFNETVRREIAGADAVLTMACGAGVQLLSGMFEDAEIFPAMNTTFLGANVAPGTWEENCRGCGQCMLAETAGICPIARCSKGLINGTCGGTKDGKCEVSKDMDCAWYLIYRRLKARGRLDLLMTVRPPVNWARSSAGVKRTMTRKELA
ncbi:MAG: methylenetetrahydrofolate reductase C-terminal domain-containing protein [Planctomycetota bacterium]|nr:methylenetetrahydrofolate reductase C-terminal domain-containing protein [Planctomycetota bacterium]